MEGQQPDTEPRNVFDKPPTEPKFEEQGMVYDISGNEKPEVINTNRYHAWDHSSAVICNDCGCLVLNVRQHDTFHEGLE